MYRSRKGNFKEIFSFIAGQVSDYLLIINHGSDTKKYRTYIIKYIIRKYFSLRTSRILKQNKYEVENYRRIFTKIILNLQP